MVKQEWQNKIIEQTQSIGTYREEFADIIDSLSTILEQRDKAYEQFIKTGGNPVITHTNKGGNANPTKNPILVMWTELNQQALTFWRDLGLTPSGLKKINEDLLIVKKGSSFEEILKQGLDELAK